MELDDRREEQGRELLGEREIGERIALIESMMRAGRKTTEYWGWSFLLWGGAVLVAAAWANLLTVAQAWAWPVTMTVTFFLSLAIARKRQRGRPGTDKSRHVQALWTAAGLGIFVFAFPVSFSGHVEPHALLAGIETLLGVAQVGSGLMLRWTLQTVVGGVWWAVAVVSCFLSSNGAAILFLAATVVCMIGFGLYLVMREAQAKAGTAAGVRHA